MHPSHRSQLARLRRIEGQVRGLARMIEDDRYCVDVLTQTRAIQAALRKVEDAILGTHVKTCVVDAAKAGPRQQTEKIAELMDVISRFT